MENLSDLAEALPPTNKDVPTQQYYKPNSSLSSRGHSNLVRGGFQNQRGPGRGRSRSRGRGQYVSNIGQGALNDTNNSWSSDRTPGQGNNEARRFTYKEVNSSNSPKPTDNYSRNSAENDLKYATNRDQKDHRNKPKIKNTVDFKPDHTPAEMRVLVASGGVKKKYNREITSRDVIVVSGLFCDPSDQTIYQNLLKEVEDNKNHEWKLWHGDNHLIADDRKRRNQSYPTFDKVIDTIRDYFNMEVHATRFNWFRDTKDWKPYHHDAAALKPEKAAVQNITVAVSFGTEREIAFQHAKTGSTVSFPLPNGTMYTFSNDVNVIWRHGVPQLPPDKQIGEGRISIVAWGWVHGVINIGNKGLA